MILLERLRCLFVIYYRFVFVPLFISAQLTENKDMVAFIIFNF